MKKTNQFNYNPLSQFYNFLGYNYYLYKCIIVSNGYWKRIGWEISNSIRSVIICKYTGILQIDNSFLILDDVFLKESINLEKSIRE